MDNGRSLTRREFLKVVGLNAAALALPFRLYKEIELPAAGSKKWPSLRLEELPSSLTRILSETPNTGLSQDGLLYLLGPEGRPYRQVPFAVTLWNQENNKSYDRLAKNLPWGIVLHWYGDKDNFEKTVNGYLRGFNTLRDVGPYITRTSAHFLISGADPSLTTEQPSCAFGILQTQAPDTDGTPFVASHLLPLDYQAHKERKQYFVRALYQLGFDGIGVHSLLQDFYDGPKVDPNLYTIAIEIAGYDFENPEHTPSEQKIANVLSVVWAVMKRYGIYASNLLGHHEIQLGKADPGKKFMALMRFLVGIKALLEEDERMKRLVFGQFLDEAGDTNRAVNKYFHFVYKQLEFVSSRRRVYEWEAASKYWFVYDHLFRQSEALPVFRNLCWPIQDTPLSKGYSFLDPGTHEGFDFYPRKSKSMLASSVSLATQLVAQGRCIFVGESSGHSQGKTTVFRHRQPDGAEIVTVYSHLKEIGDIRVGEIYPLGYQLGKYARDRSHIDPFLHFAVAYATTWDVDLKNSSNKPLNAGPGWILERYLDPVQYLQGRIATASGPSSATYAGKAHLDREVFP